MSKGDFTELIFINEHNYMNITKNINFNRVDEMAEGDVEFKTQLLQAIYTSVQDLKKKYIEGLSSNDEELIQQARHKIKPTLSLFELKRLSAILQQGKTLLSAGKAEALKMHENEFLQATDELLDELNQVIK